MPLQFDSTSVLDGLPDPMVVVDRAGSVLYANRSFLTACGTGPTGFGLPIGQVWPVMDRLTEHAIYLHGQVTGTAVQFQYVGRVGERYGISVNPITGEQSAVVFRKLDERPTPPSPPTPRAGDLHPHAALHAGMLADMGACLRAELSAPETFYQVALILGRLPDVSRATFGTVDNEARTVTIHQDFCRDAPSMEGVYPMNDTEITSLELSRGQVVVIEDVRTDYHTRDNPEMRFKRGYLSCVAVPMHRDGVWAATLMVQSPVPRVWSPAEVELIRTAAERTWLAVENMRLLTEARRANAAKDRFLAMLSHELRTPLTPVVMTLNALDEHPQIPPEVRTDLAMIRRNIDLETRLIDDLLDITRLAHGKLTISPRPTRVHELLEHVCTICNQDAKTGGIELTCKLEAPRDTVVADAARLEQVFWNLVKNAIKFTLPGGRVTIVTANGESDGDPQAPPELLVTVTDTGTGIAPDVLPRIFNAFEQGEQTVTRTYGGLGLGLAISKAIVDLHRGRIRAESGGVNRGSSFHVALPLAAVPPQPEVVPMQADGLPVDTDAVPVETNGCFQPAVPGTDVRPSRQLHVLLVDDHADTMGIMKRVLTRWGFRLTTAGRIGDALEAAAQADFDLLISDIGLPDGSGCDLVAAVQKIRPIPAIALSGFGMDADVRRSLDAGFSAHLTKPIGLDQLRDVIAKLTEPELAQPAAATP